MLALVTIVVSLEHVRVEVTEELPVAETKTDCLTWDEAKSKYNIDGDVLMEYMLQPCER